MSRAVFLTGAIGSGKSTVLRKTLELLPAQKLYGFYTKKEPPDSDGRSMIYIHPAGDAQRRYSDENRIGICTAQGGVPNIEVFERIGTQLLADIPSGALAIMDELGAMESSCPAFRAAVMRALSSDIRILGVLRKAQTEFLQQVSSHPGVQVIEVNRENRDALPEELHRSLI